MSIRPLRLFPRAFGVLAALAGACCAVAARPEKMPVAYPEIDRLDSAEEGRWQYLVIHHSASTSGNAATFARAHRAKGWDDVAYHFVIPNGRGGPDGQLEITSRWRQQKHGAHAGRLRGAHLPDEKNCFNEFGIGVCLVGHLDQQPPTPKQLTTLAALVGRLREKFAIPPEEIVGHGEVTSTACPGRRFPWPALFAAMDLPAPARPPLRRPTPTFDRCAWCVDRQFSGKR